MSALKQTLRDSTLQFKTDHRQSNPGLHQLHLGWAIQDLKIAKQAVDDLYNLSRFPASHWAAALWVKVQESIREDAAFFEAAALLYAGIENIIPDPDYRDVEAAAHESGDT